MLIQELEKLTGLERPTIRFYEKEGLITPIRTENGYRSYSEADAEKLIRIKLMRLLGVPLGKIRDLQEGAESFAEVMDAQIKTLTSQIDRDKRAKYVCTAILEDGVEYSDLDAAHYLNMFEQPIQDMPKPTSIFREQVPQQIHPWRRFAARWLDYSLLGAVIYFILFVVIRIRPILSNRSFVAILIPILCGALFVPIEALLLHLWGTTPGKLAMGIHIERTEGGNLEFSDAFERAKQVFLRGVGLRIPFISEITTLWCYCKLTGRSFWRWSKYDSISPPYDMDWDFDIEIHYDERVGKRRLALTCVLALCITLTAVTAIDSVKPRFRGDELTVEEFSRNYNNTLSLMYDDPDSTMKLQPDGTWMQRDDGSFVVVVGATPEIENANFSYETENGILRSVSYSQHYTDVAWISPIGTKCFTAAITALLSQEGCGFGDLVKFVKTWEKELAKSNTDFQYKNIRIQWQIEASDNLHQSDGTFYAIGNDVYGEIYISFCLTITSK